MWCRLLQQLSAMAVAHCLLFLACLLLAHPAQGLASAMSGICSDLEDDNCRLRREVQALKLQLATAEERGRAAHLIPQYRAVVMRARQHAQELANRLLQVGLFAKGVEHGR